MKILALLMNVVTFAQGARPTENLLSRLCGIIEYGRTRNDGGHDHRYNRGKDRTDAQRKADKHRGN